VDHVNDVVSSEFDLALRLAAEHGHTECVRLLIPVSNPKDQYSSALQLAARHGHTQCMELLIPVSNPKEHNSYALQEASSNGHLACVELLYPVSEPAVALQQLQQHHPDRYEKWGQLYEMIEAERVQHRLILEMKNTAAVKIQRKM